MKKFSFLAIVAAMLLFASCKAGLTKNGYLKNFEKFVTTMEAEGDNYTKGQMDESLETYEFYTDDCVKKYNDKLTKEDYKKIGSLSARYQKVLLKWYMGALGDAMDNGGGVLEGWLNEMDKFGDDMDDYADDLDDAADKFIDAMDDAADAMSDLFD